MLKAPGWTIDEAGYAITYQDKLIELYLPKASKKLLADVVSQLRSVAGIRYVLYKSFDTQLSEIAKLQNAQPEIVGHLFRHFQRRETNLPSHTFTFRPSEEKDLQDISNFNDDFFESDVEIEQYHSNQALFSLCGDNESVVGCGITTRVIPERNDIDLGMLVAQEWRGQGLGAYIINKLAMQCLSRRERPICGCSSDNKPSWSALQSAGFSSEHKNLLVQIT